MGWEIFILYDGYLMGEGGEGRKYGIMQEDWANF